ncbi:imidazole glycerol phosphate synthase subunit HisF [Clostridiisalibacter paucivorans]|uniref:imidazole glycerol phosphate synthase subunit HisF n=1 Tax=Clostridiisalibacter paucivorans TaxID=408753 RepID=UPI00047B70FB|nr:imidazole glycerol phosphate synthase subunit HisF [Clostridiisalibacter paucivorans]
MITKRIIPCLDVKNGRVVKGTKFKDIRDVEDPVKLAKYYNDAGADELVFYDITASYEERDIFLDVVKRTADEIFIPFTVGGGVKTLEDFTEILRSGADKISINSSAVKTPTLITEGALKFGSQCVVVSIDAKRDNLAPSGWTVYINGGRINTGLDVLKWAKKAVQLGAGELVINSIDTDGVKDGYDIELMKLISNETNVPIVASGGAGEYRDFYEVFNGGFSDAALAASVFHFNKISIPKLKNYLAKNGVNVRKD